MDLKRIIMLLAAVLTLTQGVRALELPDGLENAVPAELIESAQEGESLLAGGISWLLEQGKSALGGALRENVRAAVLLMLLVLLCGAVEGLGSGLGETAVRYVPYFGVLGAVMLCTGDLTALIGLGAQTVEELGTLSKLLLPTLASAVAASGRIGMASAWQVGTLMVTDLLLSCIRELLLPLVYCYIGVAAAGAILPQSRLDALAAALKKLMQWGLCAATVAFTAFLSLSNVLTGSADALAVKAGKFAVSSAIPVIGGILSEATEAVLAGAGALRATVGTLGVLAVLSVCLVPLLRLGVQFLLYQAAAFLSAISGMETLRRFIEQLGGAFSLVLAMTAACATLLLVSLLLAVTMVTAV